MCLSLGSVIISLSPMTLLRWLTFLRGSQTVILIVLLFWTYFFLLTSICSSMAFPPVGNSDHVVISISIDFPRNSKQDALFHRVAYDYSRADRNDLRDHLRDIPSENIFKLSASPVATEFYEWVLIRSDVYIPHRKYQVKLHSSSLFSAACAAAINHKNHLFRLHQQNKSC